MRAAKCPVCGHRKIVVRVEGSKGGLFALRSHHDPQETNLVKRMQSPMCKGSGRQVAFEDTEQV